MSTISSPHSAEPQEHSASFSYAYCALQNRIHSVINTVHRMITYLYSSEVQMRVRYTRLDECAVLIHTPLRSDAGGFKSFRFITSVTQQQGDHSMGWYTLRGEISNGCAILTMAPKILY